MSYIEKFQNRQLTQNDLNNNQITNIILNSNISIIDVINLIGKLSGKTHTYIYTNMEISKSTWENCRKKDNAKKLSFWETIRFSIVLNLNIQNTNQLLERFHYSINPTDYVCDYYLFQVLNISHFNDIELVERLEIIETIKDNFYKTPEHFISSIKKYIENE